VTAPPIDIRRLGPGDAAAVSAAGHLFDDRPRAAATGAFLADPRTHLLVAYAAGDRPVGFVTGIELVHPDKGAEMLLYELGVDERFRRRGVGRALVTALEELARERGCYGMYVLVDDDNEAARATYASAGGRVTSRPLMIDWDLGARGRQPS
jgi:ribosomal protein S18 acetylase RimI-like enzyme